MNHRTNRLIIRIVLIAIVAVIAFGILSAIVFKQHGYTGEEWYEKQDQYLSEMEEYAASIDDVMTLYITKTISSDDLLNYTGMFKKELDLMVYTYDKDLEDNPLQTGTVTNENMIATESVRKCYDVFYDILDMINDNYGDSSRLSYLYQGYHQIFNDAASGYLYVKLLEAVNDGTISQLKEKTSSGNLAEETASDASSSSNTETK